MTTIILPIQLRMARAALGLSIVAFAHRAGVSHETIVRFERGEKLKDSTVTNIRTVIERHGIVLLSDDGESGPGVRVLRVEAPKHVGNKHRQEQTRVRQDEPRETKSYCTKGRTIGREGKQIVLQK